MQKIDRPKWKSNIQHDGQAAAIDHSDGWLD